MLPTRALLLLLPLLPALPGAAHAADAGRVLLAAGDAVAIRDGRTVRLAVGATIEDRDVLRTGPDSNLQVRLTDESVLALKPGSVLAIEQYVYRDRTDGSESAVFRLLKGGFRTVTGLIGRVNKTAYRVNTGVATIGIRGTSYALALCESGGCGQGGGRAAADGLYGTVTDGEVTARNRTGESRFAVGDSFFAPRPDAPIQRLIAPPPFLSDRLEGQKRGSTRNAGESAPPPPTESAGGGNDDGNRRAAEDATRGRAPGAVTVGAERPRQALGNLLSGPLATAATDKLDSDGRTIALPAAEGFVIALPVSVGSQFATLFGDRNSGEFDAGNRLTTFRFATASGSSFDFRGDIGAGRFTDVGRVAIGESVVTWGRWVGGTLQVSSGTTFDHIPLLFATANGVANESAKANLGQVGSVTYTQVGGPSPVAVGLPTGASLISTGVSTSNLTIDFTNRSVAIDLTLSVAYNHSSTDKIANLRVFGTLSPTAASAGASTANLGDYHGSAGVSCSGTGCTNLGSTFGSDVRVAAGGKDGYGLAVATGGVKSGQTSFSAAFLEVYAAPNVSSGAVRTTAAAAAAVK